VIDETTWSGEYGLQDARADAMKELEVSSQSQGHPNIIPLAPWLLRTAAYVFFVFEICPPNGELFEHLNKVVRLSEKRTRAKRRGALTDLCGTPSYLSPEILIVNMYERYERTSVHGYGRRSFQLPPQSAGRVDMWASGVLMYTMLSGSPPLLAPQADDHVAAHHGGPLQLRFSRVGREISDAAKDLHSQAAQGGLKAKTNCC
uniref:Protein kinase domain-containing protein n=1 Tax=Macrostomum lignano TaxID=282301 RepID=A0A1I8F7E6_9PLAT